MKRIFCFLFFLPLTVFADFSELGKNSKALERSFDFSGAPLQVVQKKWLDKKYLSEADIALSPVIRGLNYNHSYSLDLTYRFFINGNWALHVRHSTHFNSRTEEGEKEIRQRSRIPVELSYPQKQSFFGGLDWYPFYGKALLYNRLLYFDLYLSLLGGRTNLLHKEKSAPAGSMALGLVCWWNQNFNARLEFQGLYYAYYTSSGNIPENRIEEALSKMSLSIGVLF